MKRKYYLLFFTIILMAISIIYLPQSFKIKQLLWLILGIFIFLIVSKIPLKYFYKIAPIFYILTNILLLLVIVIGKYNNGARAWLILGPISIQPSELAKISLILMATYLIKKQKKNIFLFILVFLIPSILTFLEPDTGAIIIYMIIFLVYCPKFFSKKTFLWLSLIVCLILTSLIILYFTEERLFISLLGTSMFYRIDRLISFHNNTNLQSQNALISIATEKLLYFPESTNDFFLAYILGQDSLMFWPIIISYICLLYFLLKNNNLISLCMFWIILFQVFWNIGMNLNILPIIGIPLPFLSYGGSHIITSYISLGLTISKDKKRLIKESNDMDNNRIHSYNHNYNKDNI